MEKYFVARVYGSKQFCPLIVARFNAKASAVKYIELMQTVQDRELILLEHVEQDLPKQEESRPVKENNFKNKLKKLIEKFSYID